MRHRRHSQMGLTKTKRMVCARAKNARKQITAQNDGQQATWKAPARKTPKKVAGKLAVHLARNYPETASASNRPIGLFERIRRRRRRQNMPTRGGKEQCDIRSRARDRSTRKQCDKCDRRVCPDHQIIVCPNCDDNMEHLQAQNMSMPTDILQSMKTTIEAAGGGSANLGPMGVFGNLSGQFGLKINKEEVTSGTAAQIRRNPRNKRSYIGQRNSRNNIEESRTGQKMKNLKRCFGLPIFLPVIRIVQAPPPATTTLGGPDARTATTTAAP
ncbi:hypothetical protein HHI36_022145 [Cryptolaemus montrouzieri]|uniref:Uncharacterized protein n=1 Tax=Cryptolaemus montrouzieri TaxID=559131 RepID=A0ABD2MZ00_9CUCU